jgi:hypothetical protein
MVKELCALYPLNQINNRDNLNYIMRADGTENNSSEDLLIITIDFIMIILRKMNKLIITMTYWSQHSMIMTTLMWIMRRYNRTSLVPIVLPFLWEEWTLTIRINYSLYCTYQSMKDEYTVPRLLQMNNFYIQLVYFLANSS